MFGREASFGGARVSLLIMKILTSQITLITTTACGNNEKVGLTNLLNNKGKVKPQFMT